MYRWERLAPPDAAKEPLFEVESTEVLKRKIWPGGPNCGIEAARAATRTRKPSRISKLERALFPR